MKNIVINFELTEAELLKYLPDINADVNWARFLRDRLASSSINEIAKNVFIKELPELKEVAQEIMKYAPKDWDGR